MAWIVVGIILIVIGAVVMPLMARSQSRRAQVLEDVPHYDCAQVAEHGEQAPGMRIAVNGRSAPAATPMVGPASQRPCVWYRLTISERVRTTDRDSEGNTRTRTEERVVSQEASPDAFALADATGRVLVEPGGAKVDQPLESFNRLEAPGGGGSTQISLGGLSINIGNRDGLVGIRRKEEILPAGDELYVLGGAFAREGEGLVSRPDTGHFIISTRSSDELSQSARTQARWLSGGAALLALAGVVLVIIGILA